MFGVGGQNDAVRANWAANFSWRHRHGKSLKRVLRAHAFFGHRLDHVLGMMRRTTFRGLHRGDAAA
ncbi:hypothetical protein DYH55_21320 [Methylovirgula sp. 4M-Z18]|nr:hypothetical protein DYH55_21320 [Methylovirgula sp. 4M-Z18]